MSKQTESNFFMVSSSLGFYQQLLSGIRTYEDLARRLLSEIRAAHLFRQTDRVRELSTILLRVPIKEYLLIAKYYLAWCDCRELKLHTNALETVIEQSQTYKAKGLVARAAHEALRGNIDPMIYFYAEALKASPNTSEYVDIVKAISAVKSVEGFHELALKDLESLLPIIKHTEPFVYFDYLNSYAVELGEVGRKEEARNISRVVLASPFAFAYPEWQETAQDLKEPNRSTVAIRPSRFIPHNILTMPATEHGETEQELNKTNSIQAPISLDDVDDKVVQFPHLVDLEELERESDERFRAEMSRFYALTDNCQLHDFVDDILMGNMNPVRFAKFLLRMSKFEDIKTVLDVFHFMLRYTFLNSDEFKESETEWTERLLQEIESTDTL